MHEVWKYIYSYITHNNNTNWLKATRKKRQDEILIRSKFGVNLNFIHDKAQCTLVAIFYKPHPLLWSNNKYLCYVFLYFDDKFLFIYCEYLFNLTLAFMWRSLYMTCQDLDNKPN